MSLDSIWMLVTIRNDVSLEYLDTNLCIGSFWHLVTIMNKNSFRPFVTIKLCNSINTLVTIMRGVSIGFLGTNEHHRFTQNICNYLIHGFKHVNLNKSI